MKRQDRAIILLAVGQTLAWAGIYYVFPALLLRWEETLGWTKAELTGALTLAIAVSAILSPFTGRIIDSGRGPALMGGSAVLGGLGLLALSQVQALWQFYTIWLVIGAAMAGGLYEPCFAIVTRNKGDKARGGIIFITLIAGFASTISFPTVHYLAEGMGWRNTLLIFGLIEILAVAPILGLGARRLEKTGDHAGIAPSPPQTGVFRSLLRTPAYWYLAAGFASVALVHGATLHHLLPLLNERGLSLEFAVLIASLIGPMQVAGRIAMTATLRFASNHRIALCAFTTIGLSMLILLAAGTAQPAIVVFVLLFASAYGTISILRPVIARETLGGQNFGAISGALALPYLAGSASAPYLGSLIWAAGGYGLMLTICTAMTILGLGFYILARKADRIQR